MILLRKPFAIDEYTLNLQTVGCDRVVRTSLTDEINFRLLQKILIVSHSTGCRIFLKTSSLAVGYGQLRRKIIKLRDKHCCFYKFFCSVKDFSIWLSFQRSVKVRFNKIL